MWLHFIVDVSYTLNKKGWFIMHFTIRAISPNEAEAYFSLVNEVKDEGKYLFATFRISLENIEKYIAHHYNSSNPVLGAFNGNDRLVGWIDLSPGTIQELAHVGTIGMGVKKEYRGQGIGSALLDACIEQARKIGLEKLELEVFASNAAARALYRKKGFFEEGIRLKKRKFEGHYDDVVCMGLFIND
ncbi:MAG TPA: GNAT family N-acetyltransferase [Rectinema sp.]|nr:GNAT family N-acetyltransferase [Rectinema sp.]